jgi:uncharacterized repeat protein (TIGR01451 family)
VESTLSGNAAQYGGGIYYGGDNNPGALLRLTNTTLSGNVVYRPFAGTGTADGGGLYVDGGRVQLFNTTIASNRVQISFSHPYFGIGGGVYLTATSVFTAENSLIANNVHGNGLTTAVHDDCFSYGTTGALMSDLILTDTNCAVSGTHSGLIVGQDPLLGPLQDNGGSTETRALSAGSPAIDGGDPAGCTGAGGAPITNDQRGAPRPAFGDPDPTCDIGAFEVVPEADLSVAKHGSSNTVRVGAPLTYTVTITDNGPVPASGVLLTDTLPGSVNLNTAVSSQGSCSGTIIVICNLGSLASGSNVTVTVAVTTAATGVITNTVTVTANEFDPVLANNTASETTVVVRQLYLPLIARGP